MVWSSLVFAFFGLMRVSEYTTLLRVHVQFNGTDVVLTLLRTKNSQNNRSYVTLSRTVDPQLCPVKSYHNFIGLRDRIFRADCTNFFVFANGSPLGSQTMNDIIKQLALSAAHPHPDRLSSHSLRIGGASEAARAGVNLRVIQQMGRWNSDCFLRYIRLQDRDIADAQKLMCGFDFL